MTPRAPLLEELAEGRARFLELVAGLRPELHRYCARMVGSTFDGEDVLQEALARAYYELPQLAELPALRAWLFRIAHNCATDFLRASRRRQGREEELDWAQEPADDRPSAESHLVQEESVTAAVGAFVQLPPAQRACVVLKDVLGFPLEEIASVLELSVPAVKAALHRGRRQLGAFARPPEGSGLDQGPLVLRYVERFNARDWNGVRGLLADDVRLDLVARWKRRGREDVSRYYTNYASLSGWEARPARLEGRAGLAVLPRAPSWEDWYFVALEGEAGAVRAIRDYRYSAYMFAELRPEVVGPADEAP